MALSDSSIKELKNARSSGKNALENFRSGTSEHFEELSRNADYSLFVENTEIGRELNTTLTKLLEISSNVGNDIEKFWQAIGEFCDTQERLNSYNGSAQGGTTDYVPTTVKSSQVGNGVGVVSSNGTVTLPGGIRVPSSAINGGGH